MKFLAIGEFSLGDDYGSIEYIWWNQEGWWKERKIANGVCILRSSTCLQRGAQEVAIFSIKTRDF